MTQTDALDANLARNGLLTTFIIGLYASALVAVVVLVFQSVIPAVQAGEPVMRQILAATALILLSVFFVVFYIRFVIYLRDSVFGKTLSICLVVIFLILVVSGVIYGYVTLVGIGLTFVVWKTLQLFRLLRDKGTVQLTRKYVRRIVFFTGALAVVSLSVGIIVDTGVIAIFGDVARQDSYNGFEESLLIQVGQGQVDSTLLAQFRELHRELGEAQTLNQVFYLMSLSVFFALVVYALFKVILVRRFDMREIYDELERYYQNRAEDPPSRGIPGSVSIFFGLITTMRPFVSVIAALIALSCYLVSAESLSPVTGLLLFIAVFFTSSFGFVLNDFFDYQIDLIGHPERALPRGLVTRQLLMKAALCFATISVSAAAFVSLIVTLLVTATLVLLALYSEVKWHSGILANVVTAVTCSLTLVVGAVAGTPVGLLFILAIAAFFFTFGREILLDLRDEHSDSLFGRRSIPLSIGRTQSTLLAGVAFLIASIISLFLSITSQNLGFFIFIGCIFNTLLWAGYFGLLVTGNSRWLSIAVVSSRLGFLAVIPGVLSLW